MNSTVRIEGDGSLVRIIGSDTKIAVRLLKDAIDDIADQIELEAVAFAPEGDDEAGYYPGKTPLKDHPVDRADTVAGFADTRNPLFGGGFALRGATGFIPGVGQEGQVVAQSEITVARIPRHAIWVHEGTGIYGPYASPIVPRKSPFLVFMWKGKLRRREFVLGQKPQPYLTEAYFWVDQTYVPLKMQELRARIAIETGG